MIPHWLVGSHWSPQSWGAVSPLPSAPPQPLAPPQPCPMPVLPYTSPHTCSCCQILSQSSIILGLWCSGRILEIQSQCLASEQCSVLGLGRAQDKCTRQTMSTECNRAGQHVLNKCSCAILTACWKCILVMEYVSGNCTTMISDMWQHTMHSGVRGQVVCTTALNSAVQAKFDSAS